MIKIDDEEEMKFMENMNEKQRLRQLKIDNHISLDTRPRMESYNSDNSDNIHHRSLNSSHHFNAQSSFFEQWDMPDMTNKLKREEREKLLQ